MDTQLLLPINHYYDTIDELNNNTDHTINRFHLKILQFNIRGMNSIEKFDNLKEILTMYSGRVDVLVIGETWVKENRANFFQIDGYSSIFSCRSDSQGGGLAVYIRKSLAFDVLSLEHTSGFHHIYICLDVGVVSMHLHAVYRPPSYDYSTYLTKLDSFLTSLKPNTPCVVIGDVNIPINQPGNPVAKEYTDLLDCYNFAVTNTIATRPASSNILDHMVCSEELQRCVVNDTIFSNISDHCIVISTFHLSKPIRHQTLEKIIVDHRKLNEAFEIAMHTCVSNTAEERLRFAIHTYQEMKKRYSKSVTIRAKIKGCCPWMTFDLWKLMRLKENALKSRRKQPNDEHRSEIVKHISKKVQQEKDRAKQIYYRNLFNNTNQKNVWRNLNKVLGHQKDREESVKLMIDGELTNGGDVVANHFNHFFSTIGPQLASTITSNQEILKFGTISSNDNSIFLRPTTENEVLIRISELNVQKSSGPDSIPASFLKTHHDIFAELLRDVFNECINTSRYPDCLKTTRVIPIYKAGPKSDVSNYRPISIISVLSKILEQLLVARITDFVRENRILYNHQYGFRRGSSTLTAACELVEEIHEAMDSRKLTGVLFLDLKKAFDTIDHNILLKKLDLYGIRGIANDMIRSYLTNRMQFVLVNRTKSAHRTMTVGVPQGSNLGPLLFLLYINDLPKLKLHGKARLFADDTSLSYVATNVDQLIQQMTDDMQILQQYFNENLLSLNLTKTKYMIFHTPQSSLPSHAELIVNSTIVERTNSFKYLGLTFDSSLSWKVHIEMLQKELSSTCGLLWKVSKFVPSKQMLSMYHAFVQSKVQYMVSIWGSATKYSLKKIQSIQNRSLKTVYKKPHLYPTLELYKNAAPSILPISALRELQSVVQIHKFLHISKTHHNHILTRTNHGYRTRNQSSLILRKPNTELRKRSFGYYGRQRYNALPTTVKAEHNIRKYSNAVTAMIRSNLEKYIV